jgi:hypothetical protein
VQLTEEKRNIDGKQVLVTKLAIGKKEKHFYAEVSGKKEVTVKSTDEGIEYLIMKYNLQQ